MCSALEGSLALEPVDQWSLPGLIGHSLLRKKTRQNKIKKQPSFHLHKRGRRTEDRAPHYHLFSYLTKCGRATHLTDMETPGYSVPSHIGHFRGTPTRAYVTGSVTGPQWVSWVVWQKVVSLVQRGQHFEKKVRERSSVWDPIQPCTALPTMCN